MKATIIENSLIDLSILNKVNKIKSWKSGDWKLHIVDVSEDMINEFSKNLKDGPWYIHFYEEGSNNIVVVFKENIFNIDYSDKSTWKEAVNHGLSIGIPMEQLDFAI